MLNRNDEDVGSVLLSVFAVKCYDSETMIKMIQKVKLPPKLDGISMNFKLLCFTVMYVLTCRSSGAVFFLCGDQTPQQLLR